MCVCVCVCVVIYEAFCLDMTQDRMNEATNRLELTLVGLLVKFANHDTTRDAHTTL